MVITNNKKLEVILKSREDAELVLDRMNEILAEFGSITVMNLKELIGAPTTHVDRNWGWTDLTNTEFHQVREGYLLTFPPVKKLNRINKTNNRSIFTIDELVVQALGNEEQWYINSNGTSLLGKNKDGNLVCIYVPYGKNFNNMTDEEIEKIKNAHQPR